MGQLRSILVGLVLGVLLFGCAGWSFHEYTIAAESYAGKLLGPKEKDDIPFSDCAPTARDLAPCVAMKTAEFLRLKQDYIDMQQKLKDCQSGVEAR